MRFELFVGGILAAGLSLAAVACGSSESSGQNPEDGNPGETNGSTSGGSSGASSSGGSSGEASSSGGSSSGGTSSGTIPAKELAKGFATVIGIVGDDVVYQSIETSGITLNVIPIAGGTATKIADMAQGDRAVARGGAVGLWKTVTSGIGTFNVWTKAGGLKAGPASSLVGLFNATTDGSRIVVSVAATANSSRFAVLDPATITAATTYNGGDNAAANIASTCVPFLRFAGKTFVGAYCTTGSAVRARLVVMADGATTFDSVVSNNTNAAGIQPYFQLSKDNSKVMVLGLPNTETGVTADEQLRIVTLPAGATQIIDTDVYDGVLTDDGSAVIYQSGTGQLKRASTGAAPTPVEIAPANSIKSVVEYSSDRSRVLFASTDADPDGKVDLKTATTAAANAPAAVATGVQPLGFSANSLFALYFAETATGASLKAKAVSAGTEKDLFKDPEIALVPPSGDRVVVGHDSKELTLGSANVNVFALSSVTIGNATVVSLAADVPEGEWTFKDDKLVYSRLVVNNGAPAAGTGLYVVTLP